MNNLGAVLRAYRLKNDIEQKALADEIGICHSTLCRIEKGKLPDAKGLAAILDWLVKEKLCN